MNRHVRRFVRVFLMLAVTRMPAMAQSDSLTAADTIHLKKQQSFLTTRRLYKYHFADNLTDRQLLPLLRRSADSTVQHYLKRGQQAHYTTIGVTASGYGLMATGMFTPLRQPQTNLTLMAAGVGLFYGSLIPSGCRSRLLEQAIRAHNQLIRSRTTEYYTPLTLPPEQRRLSLGDTIGVQNTGLSRRYVYRGLRVMPVLQMSPLAERLNDNDVKDGFRYTRRVSNIGRLFTSFGIGFLVPRLLLYGIQRANGRSATFGSPIVWTSLAVITVGYGIRIHGNSVQNRTVQLLNERLRSRYDPAVVGEHFYVP